MYKNINIVNNVHAFESIFRINRLLTYVSCFKSFENNKIDFKRQCLYIPLAFCLEVMQQLTNEKIIC